MNAARKPKANGELVYLPLGGVGEIGMNLSLYGYDGKWLMVDLGVTFGGEEHPGINLIVPDISFLDGRAGDLAAIVLTHAHEDHLGAVPHLWERLKCPVYGTPFALGLLRRKLAEKGLENRVPMNEIPPGGGFEAGPFNVDFIRMAHSIPETQALAITTKAGTVLHVTDWKIDPQPLIGPETDADKLRRLGAAGPIALMCDSTNVFETGRSGSEGELRDSLIELVGKCRNRVAIACFASNIARLETIAAAAAANDRHVALIGRSLWNYSEIARECGYLADTATFLSPAHAAHLPRDKVLIAVTGSQGEPAAALSRIARGDHPDITLERGDTVIFSSRVIPGNEKPIGRVQNQLARLGVEIITEADHFVHVSGHPARDELSELYSWIKPKVLVPIHGEGRHLVEHQRFARENQVPGTVLVENGDMLRLHPGPVEIVGRVAVGRMAVQGNRLIPLEGAIMGQRRRIAANGLVLATVVLDRKGRLAEDPQISFAGLTEDFDENTEDEIYDGAVDAIDAVVTGLSKGAAQDDDRVADLVRRALRRCLRESFGRRPVVEVHIVRL